MAQISAGHNYTSTGANSLVTAINLNQHVNNAQLQGGAIGDQTNIGVVTGSEYSLIYNPSTGSLYKTQLTNLLLSNNQVLTNNISSESTNIRISNDACPAGGTITVFSKGDLLLRGGGITISAMHSIDSADGNLFLYAQDDMTLSATGDIDFMSPVAFYSNLKLPVGTTAERPATPEAGLVRYNSTLSSAETYNGTDWGSLAAIVDSSLTANGYVKLSNGLTIQWGTFYATGLNNIPNPQIVPLPIAFTTAIVYANTSVDGANSSGDERAHLDWTTSGKTTTSQLGIYVNYIGTCKFWAIGY